MKSQVELLKALIAKETDETKRGEYEDQMLAAIKDEAASDVAKTFEEKVKAQEVEIARLKADSGRVPYGQGITTVPGDYKGFRFKAEMENLLINPKAPRRVVEMWKADPGRLERTAKFWLDHFERALRSPIDAAVMRAPMTEGSTTAGGYMTPDEQRADMLAYLREQSLALRECTHYPMQSDTLLIPGENAKVAVAYTNENTAATETTPSVRQVSLTAKRMDAYTDVTNELIQDAKIGGTVASWLLGQFTEAVGLKVDSTVFLCGGDPMSSVFSASAGYSQTFGTGSSAFSELLESDIRGIMAKVPAHYLTRARFWAHQNVVFTYLYGLKDSQERPLWVNDLTGEFPYRVYGVPVIFGTMSGPSVSAAATGFIGYGDLRGVAIGDRLTNIDLFTDPYTQASKYITRFYLFTRWGYALAMPSMLGRIVTAA